MTTFLLVRHALHEYGGERIAGRTPEVHLSPEGGRQADALAARLASIRIDALYASPILRCQETARRIVEGRGLAIETDDALTELDFGEWTGERLDALETQDRWKRFNAFRSGTRAPGGEFFLETQLRIVRRMLELKERHPDATVALVSHADVIRSALLHCLGVPMDLFLRLEISPASVSVVAIADYGPWVLGINHTGDLPVLP